MIVLILSIFLTGNAFGKEACVEIFIQNTPAVSETSVREEVSKSPEKEKTALEKITQEQLEAAAKELAEQMSSLESKIEWWSNLTGQYERTSLFALRDRRKKFIFYFEKSNELYEAVNIYRETFKNLELSFLQMKKYYSTPVAERGALYSAKQIKEIETVFGENYGDYKHVRQYLEAMMVKEPSDATSPEGLAYANAKYVLGRLGVPVMAERFEGLAATRERPSLTEIENLFRSTPGPLFAKLKRDLREERSLAIRTFVYGTLQLQAIQQLIFKVLPAKLKEPITNFLGINYNSYVLKRYLSDIELVVSAKTPENQLAVFREIAAKHSSNDFYLTFARLVSYTDIWINLRKLVVERKDAAVYKRLLEDMDKAEAQLKDYSFLPQFHKPSLIDHFTKWIAPIGITSATYFYTDFAVVKQSVLDMYQYVAGALPF